MSIRWWSEIRRWRRGRDEIYLCVRKSEIRWSTAHIERNGCLFPFPFGEMWDVRGGVDWHQRPVHRGIECHQWWPNWWDTAGFFGRIPSAVVSTESERYQLHISIKTRGQQKLETCIWQQQIPILVKLYCAYFVYRGGAKDDLFWIAFFTSLHFCIFGSQP